MLMAGLDGMANKTEPGDPIDKNIYDLPPEEAANVRQVPSARGRSIRCGCARVRGSSICTSTFDSERAASPD
jgi:glutamine synthetase